MTIFPVSREIVICQSFCRSNKIQFEIQISLHWNIVSFSLVQFRCSVGYESLWPHESQHARLPCPSPTPGVYSNPCPSSWWCHPTISSSVVPFSSCPQSIPVSGYFPMSQLITWGGQSTGISPSASILPVNTHLGNIILTSMNL